MPNPIMIAGILAIMMVGLVLLVLRMLGHRKGDDWQSFYRSREPNMPMRHNTAAVWLTDKSAERHEEHRDFLRERAKNDRHQDLD
jgi:high-affinity Fe2+/Pb2+ permease